jgi:hypothetical protein
VKVQRGFPVRASSACTLSSADEPKKTSPPATTGWKA